MGVLSTTLELAQPLIRSALLPGSKSTYDSWEITAGLVGVAVAYAVASTVMRFSSVQPRDD